MSNGYLDVYREREKIKSGMQSNFTSKYSKSPNQLTSNQLAAYNWLVESSFLKYIDNISQNKLVELVTEKNFLALFNIATTFNIKIQKPTNSKPNTIKESIALLIKELITKDILNYRIDPNAILRCEKRTILTLIETLYNKAINDDPHIQDEFTAETISEWLIQLGLLPPYGESWFSDVDLYLLEDPIRNGEIFQKLCLVFRPEVFDSPYTPPKDPTSIINVTNQCLMMFYDEGIIESEDIDYSKDIVKGNTDVIIKILSKIYKGYLKHFESMKLEIFN
ncbi:hypothetical protein TVAG_268990 [Trichomonas vaginalis G3]|uniref:Calponin-homology (CH) domain-containing protein n=1 Tax=Trichomonas vaginalis (strain ATCC PRA-98 / G3) TaxID=412133 RepID=A2EG12_TRIV3|nr:hypothetical protein TVAGG3_0842270 [Trichomonas vaginalis G3]EAY08373.1 hypothetical protein TVAG_268990 [Trichomonas vaginalis G3]KAI5499347.1 hypothetical protein TVAGG3_0842270 [Trichomonas vaginalis G3]|eukprot:XP_001320596.1 hypothetical protein [Trichomonas vaginalis G3]